LRRSLGQCLTHRGRPVAAAIALSTNAVYDHLGDTCIKTLDPLTIAV